MRVAHPLALLFLASVARSAAPRRLRRGTSYRYIHEVDRVSDAEVAQIQRHQPNWKLLRRTGKTAVFRADVVAENDGELIVPSPWTSIAGLGFVDDNDTDGRWRVVDVRAAEV